MKTKHFLAGLFLTATLSMTAQTRIINMLNRTNGSNFDLMQKINKKESQDAIGSPYVDNVFNLASISGVTDVVMVKYNAETDAIDINSGDDKIFELPKDSEFGTVTFKNGKAKYVLHSYVNEKGENVRGYLNEISAAPKAKFFKRERIALIPERQPSTGYDRYVPPKYDRVNDVYYLQVGENAPVVYPKNRKELVAMFPERKSEIEAYLKKNKTSFKKEQDLVLLTAFLGA